MSSLDVDPPNISAGAPADVYDSGIGRKGGRSRGRLAGGMTGRRSRRFSRDLAMDRRVYQVEFLCLAVLLMFFLF